MYIFSEPNLLDDEEYFTEDINENQSRSKIIEDTEYFDHSRKADASYVTDEEDKDSFDHAVQDTSIDMTQEAFENDDEIDLEPFVDGTEMMPDPPGHRETAK